MTMLDVGISVGDRLFWISHVLTIAVRAVGGLVHPGAIEEIETDLTKVIEDFECAVDVETLRRMRDTGEHSFPAGIYSQLLRYRAGDFARAARTRQDGL